MFNKDVIIRVRAQIEGIRPRLYIYIYINIYNGMYTILAAKTFRCNA